MVSVHSINRKIQLYLQKYYTDIKTSNTKKYSKITIKLDFFISGTTIYKEEKKKKS